MSDDYKIFNISTDLVKDPTSKYDFNDNPRYPIWLSNSLQMTCHEKDLIALSAPQVQMSVRAFYMVGFDSAMFNPIIVDMSTTQSYSEETSPSFPGIIVKIKRPDSIRLRWTDALGETQTNVYGGLTARIIQRKIDFLDGMGILDKAAKYHKEQALKKRVQIDKI